MFNPGRLSLVLAWSPVVSSGFISAATLFTGPDAPVVDLGYARYRGKQDNLTHTSNYLGVPYAKASRFDHAQVFNEKLDAVQDASDYGDACPQHSLASQFSPDTGAAGPAVGLLESLPFGQEILRQSEECLSINIQRPQDQSLKDLPVVVWIHGGGFEVGASSSPFSENSATPGVFYQGANIVRRSIQMDKPIIVTSINYRLNHFGFTASKEFEEAGLLNLGLEDQRVALRWIQRNIRAFGGDPTKVTIMGESAGSWSVTAQLVANNGDNEGLFRSVMGISGGPLKVDGPERQQALFDDMVQYVGCASAGDKIDCLRKVPYSKIYEHMQSVNFLLGFRSLASAWTIRPDGKFITESPDKLVKAGKMNSNVALLYGDMKDEGTLFSQINSLNLTTTEDVKDYFKTYWWPKATEAQLDRLFELYPQDPTQGSPFDTGLRNSVPIQYKRISALTGDYSFESQRRTLLQNSRAPRWNYQIETALPLGGTSSSPAIDTLLGPIAPGQDILSQNFHGLGTTDIPQLGSFHASDVFLYWFGTIPEELSRNSYHLMGVLVAFVSAQDPNQHGMEDVPEWPRWDDDASAGKATMRFRESGVDVVRDDYRAVQMDYINEIGDDLRV